MNRKISQLSKQVILFQSQNEQLQIKYRSAKQKTKSIESVRSKEIEAYRIENLQLKKDNEGLNCDIQDLIKENDSLITKINCLYSKQTNTISNTNANKDNDDCGKGNVINSYNKQLQEANESISKMLMYIKELEHKNEKLIEEIDNNQCTLLSTTQNGNKDVIEGLKKVITEKEKTISTLYNNYDKLNIQLEDSNNKNEELLEQIKALKMQFNTKEDFNNNENDDYSNDDNVNDNNEENNQYMTQY